MPRLLLSLALVILSWTPTRMHAEELVKLLAVHGFDCPPVSGCYESSKIKGTVLLKNIGASPTVDIVYFDFYRRTWDFVPATRLMTLPDARELWTFLVPASVQEFAIAYHVGGAVFWDNNGGNNYPGAHYGYHAWLGETPLFFGPELQWTWIVSGAETVATGYDPDRARFTGGIWVQGKSREQTLTVVYTDDQWATTHTVAAAPVPGHSYPSGVELWSFEAPVSAGAAAANIEFAVVLQRGSETIWDNNFGRNFRIGADLKFSR